MNINYFTFYYMLDILLKTLVCNYLQWNFFPVIFVLHLLIFNPFCTRFYFVCVCVCVCVCVFSFISAHFCPALICLALCWASALLCSTIFTICFCQCDFILNTSFLTLIDNIAIAVLWLIRSIILWYTRLICYSIHKKGYIY